MSEQNTTHTAGRQVWFITGAGRGMGVDIAKAVLAAGHAVVGDRPRAISRMAPSRLP